MNNRIFEVLTNSFPSSQENLDRLVSKFKETYKYRESKFYKTDALFILEHRNPFNDKYLPYAEIGKLLYNAHNKTNGIGAERTRQLFMKLMRHLRSIAARHNLPY